MKVRLFSRKSISTITGSNDDGRTLHLDEIQPFSFNDLLADFIHDDTTDIRFLRLLPGQAQEFRIRDTRTLVIVTSGQGRLLGDDNRQIEKDDVISVDAGAKYGFHCDGDEYLETVHIQLDDKASLKKTPRLALTTRPVSTADRLIEYNEKKCRDIEKSLFFEIFRDGTMQDTRHLVLLKTRLRQWSGLFQKIMYTRQFSTVETVFSDIFLEHLKDELGHDEMLPTSDRWDPEIDAFGNWFVLKMLQLDNLEKLVVVHLVLEKCADVFHAFAKQHITESGGYIDAHAELDHDHSALGAELYDNLTKGQYLKMERLCEHSWHMLRLLLDRVATLTMQDINTEEHARETTTA